MINEELNKRVLKEAKYFLKHKTNVRETSKHFDVSKSTIHRDISYKLQFIDKKMFNEIRNILDENFKLKSKRGGESTKEKFNKL